MNRKELRPTDPQKIRRIFLKEIGYKAVAYLEKENQITYYLDSGDDEFNLEFVRQHRIVSLQIPVDRPDRQVDIDFQYQHTAFVNLIYTILTFILRRESDLVYYQSHQELQNDTLSFLRYLWNWAQLVDQKCAIFLYPSTEKRKRFYERITRDYPNIVVTRAEFNDLKTNK